MRYDADRRRGRLVFRKRTCLTGALVPTQSLCGTAATAAAAAAAADASDRVAGMIKKTAYRSSGRRVRGEDDKIPPIKTAAPDLPLAVLRRMGIRVDPRSAPTCAPPNALRIRPANASTSGAHVSRSDVRSYEGVGPVPPPPDRDARSHMQHRLLHLRVQRARRQCKDRQVLGRVVPLAAAPSRRVGSKSRHSQVPVLRPRDRAHRERDAPHPPQRQGQGRGVVPSLPRLAVLPAPRPAARPLPYGVAWSGQHRCRSGSPAQPCLRALG